MNNHHFLAVSAMLMSIVLVAGCGSRNRKETVENDFDSLCSYAAEIFMDTSRFVTGEDLEKIGVLLDSLEARAEKDALGEYTFQAKDISINILNSIMYKLTSNKIDTSAYVPVLEKALYINNSWQVSDNGSQVMFSCLMPYQSMAFNAYDFYSLHILLDKETKECSEIYGSLPTYIDKEDYVECAFYFVKDGLSMMEEFSDSSFCSVEKSEDIGWGCNADPADFHMFLENKTAFFVTAIEDGTNEAAIFDLDAFRKKYDEYYE